MTSGRGLTIGVLSGMRSVVADIIWVVPMTLAWEKQEWFKMGGYINLCTSLQPRVVTFWDMGAWQLAWNASVAAEQNVKEPNPLKRLKARAVLDPKRARNLPAGHREQSRKLAALA